MKIYRGYDQAGLDRQYNARYGIADVDDFIARYSSESARVRAIMPGTTGLAFGPTKAEVLDVFAASAAGAPIHLFIHGGYWRMLSKDDGSHFAETLVPAGATHVAVNYALAPAVSIDEIVRQNRAALAWVYRNAESFGGDRDRIFLSGHSAGGHLVGQMLVTDWQGDYGLPRDLIKGACAVSGLFDLEPIRLSNVNEWARLDAAAAARNSPIRHIPDHGCPLIVAYGGDESDEFRRQSDDFAAAWKARGLPCEEVAMPGHHHFSVIEGLARPDNALGRAWFRRLGLPGHT